MRHSIHSILTEDEYHFVDLDLKVSKLMPKSWRSHHGVSTNSAKSDIATRWCYGYRLFTQWRPFKDGHLDPDCKIIFSHDQSMWVNDMQTEHCDH